MYAADAQSNSPFLNQTESIIYFQYFNFHESQDIIAEVVLLYQMDAN